MPFTDVGNGLIGGRDNFMKVLGISLFIFVVFISSVETWSEEIDCAGCHGDLASGKFVHTAIINGGGCPACHTGVDAKDIPHKFLTNAPKGLLAEGGDLCYACHGRTKFSAATIHAPVGVGLCISCHNPHKSENKKLLIAEKQTLCFNCHEKEKLTGMKSTHKPVREGLCLECHDPHASNNLFLVLRKGNILCRKCHPTVEKSPHAVTALKTGGHPIRGKEDPKRPGKIFECLSCHLPHTSEWGKLFRYRAESTFDLCIYCHMGIF